jgi:hypothetical protein
MTEALYSAAIIFSQVLSCLIVDAVLCLVGGPRIASWTVATLRINLLVGRVLSEHPFKLGVWVNETYRLGYNDP